MDKRWYIQRIVADVERYFRIFSRAETIQWHTGDLEWITPFPGQEGPSIVYRIALQVGIPYGIPLWRDIFEFAPLEEESAGERLDKAVEDIRSGRMPSLWYVTPTATPDNVVDLLVERGFTNLSAAPGARPEYGMALDLAPDREWPAPSSAIKVKRVSSREAFAAWVDTVNTALHGRSLLQADVYFPWVAQDDLNFYLAYVDGAPAGTAATIDDGRYASLEFVSTLNAYRRRGVATALCIHALRDLQGRGVRTVTLGSSPESTPLYEKLGFVKYYAKTLLSYEG